jgi:hypothetical protein
MSRKGREIQEVTIGGLRRLAAPTLDDRPMDADIEPLARQISNTGFPGEY